MHIGMCILPDLFQYILHQNRIHAKAVKLGTIFKSQGEKAVKSKVAAKKWLQ